MWGACDPSFCNECERLYCIQCSSIEACGGCDAQVCDHCKEEDENCQEWDCENHIFVTMNIFSNAPTVRGISARSVRVQQRAIRGNARKFAVRIVLESLIWMLSHVRVKCAKIRVARSVVGLSIKQLAMLSVRAAVAFFSCRSKRKMKDCAKKLKS